MKTSIEITEGDIQIIEAELYNFMRDTNLSLDEVKSNPILFSELFCKHYKDNVWFYENELFKVDFETKERSTLAPYLPISVSKYTYGSNNECLLNTRTKKIEVLLFPTIWLVLYFLFALYLSFKEIDIFEPYVLGIITGLLSYLISRSRFFIYKLRIKYLNK